MDYLEKYVSKDILNTSKQLITVISSNNIDAMLKYWKNVNGTWINLYQEIAIIGKNGLTSNKQEGDMKTPKGEFKLLSAFGIDKYEHKNFPYTHIKENEKWIDDVNSKYYNTMQITEELKDWNSAEELSKETTAYKYSVVIDYNIENPIPGKGSAIFFHIKKNNYTAGCVAISENLLKTILDDLNTKDNPYIIIKQA